MMNPNTTRHLARVATAAFIGSLSVPAMGQLDRLEFGFVLRPHLLYLS